MAYALNGQVENTDINDTLLNPLDAAKRLNAIWGAGYGNRGYGQGSLLPNVEKGKIVTASDWNEISNRTTRISQHQNNPLVSTGVATGDPINFNEGKIRTNIELVDDTRFWAGSQSTGVVYRHTNQFAWQNQLTYNITIIFNTPDQARYFWNCGGQLAISTFQPATVGKPITELFTNLASAMGTIYWTAIAGGGKKTKIAGVDFDAVTKIGGSGTPVTIAKNIDFYDNSLYNAFAPGVTLFEQKVANTVPAYSNSLIKLTAVTAGTKGLNGGNGYTVFMKLIYDSVPDGAVMPPGGGIAVTVIPPTTSWLFTQSWSNAPQSVGITTTAI